MSKYGRPRARALPSRTSPAVLGLMAVFALYLAFRVISTLNGTAPAGRIYGLVPDGTAAGRILGFELGAMSAEAGDVDIAELVLGAAEKFSAADEPSPTVSETPSGALSGDSPSATDAGLYYDLSRENGQVGDKPSPSPNVVTKPVSETTSGRIAVHNKSRYAVDPEALLSEPVSISLAGDSPAVLIIHTHGSEAYLPDAEDRYTPSDPFRTEDKRYNVVRVGDELAAELARRGIGVVHDRGIYDYPSYQGAYTRSYEAIQSYLGKYPSIKIVIDLHRDAIQGSDGTVYKTIAQIGETTCAQVMFVMGTDSSGLKHPNWRENLKLAVKIQQEMNRLYPSLAKPIEISQYRYNQQATTGSMLVEIGCTGNTLKEALAAARYFADAAANVILGLYKSA